MSEKKYNHAFTIAFSLNSDMSPKEWEEHIRTRKGVAEASAHLIKRVQQVIEDNDSEAFDLWDSYENY